MHTQLISISDAVRRFGVSADTLKRWAAAGRIRCWRDARGRRLFHAEELEHALAPVRDTAKPGTGKEPEADGGSDAS